MRFQLFTISLLSEDIFSVESLRSRLHSEFNTSKYCVESGIANYLKTDLLIILFSSALLPNVLRYLMQYKTEIAAIGKIVILGEDNCFRLFKGLQTKSLYFKCINIKTSIEGIVNEISVFIKSLNNGKVIFKKMHFPLPQKRKEVVKYIIKGFLPHNIAKVMGLNIKTISAHKRIAMEALSVKTTTELVIKQKIIDEFMREEKAIYRDRIAGTQKHN